MDQIWFGSWMHSRKILYPLYIFFKSSQKRTMLLARQNSFGIPVTNEGTQKPRGYLFVFFIDILNVERRSMMCWMIHSERLTKKILIVLTREVY